MRQVYAIRCPIVGRYGTEGGFKDTASATYEADTPLHANDE